MKRLVQELHFRSTVQFRFSTGSLYSNARRFTFISCFVHNALPVDRSFLPTLHRSVRSNCEHFTYTAPWKVDFKKLLFVACWCTSHSVSLDIVYDEKNNKMYFFPFLHETLVTRKKCTQTHSKLTLLNESLLTSRSPVERNTTEQRLLNATDLSLSYFVLYYYLIGLFCCLLSL